MSARGNSKWGGLKVSQSTGTRAWTPSVTGQGAYTLPPRQWERESVSAVPEDLSLTLFLSPQGPSDSLQPLHHTLRPRRPQCPQQRLSVPSFYVNPHPSLQVSISPTVSPRGWSEALSGVKRLKAGRRNWLHKERQRNGGMAWQKPLEDDLRISVDPQLYIN